MRYRLPLSGDGFPMLAGRCAAVEARGRHGFAHHVDALFGHGHGSRLKQTTIGQDCICGGEYSL